jgi:prephenate dehydratase
MHPVREEANQLNAKHVERKSAAGRRTVPSPSFSPPEAGRQSVVYPGPVGSHTASAAAALFPSAQLVPLAGFHAVVDAVRDAEAEHGVLPIESSLVGAVAETHDLLYEGSLSIVAETVQPIVHCLAGPDAIDLSLVRVVRSHPMALDQCRSFLAALPHASVLPVSTTAEAARLAREDGDPTHVAIVAPSAVPIYGLTMLADDIGDHTAYTRFVSIARYTRAFDLDRAAARTAFSFVTKHQPGALHKAIGPIAAAGLDLERLVSRPLPRTAWKYRFDAVVSGHPLDPAVQRALAGVRAESRELRVLGVYEAHEEGV